ncbi:basic proline-rich protein-like [Odocoileus virginianus]|uniref:Basic proline-rich protein-like n=1 Tax=Odocoileus virginianus TaxID=9874 RepID=A0A6J0Y6V1_ODOVR
MLPTLCRQTVEKNQPSLVRWPGCRDCKDQRAKPASLSALVGRSASGGTERVTPPEPRYRERPGARPAPRRVASSPAFPLPKPSCWRATLLPPRAPGPEGGGRSASGQARAPRPAPRMEPDPSCSRAAGPGTRDPEPTAPPLHPRGGGAALLVPPPLSPPTRRGPRSHEGRSRGTAVERGSGLEQQDRSRVGNGEEGRQGAAENPNTGSPPPPGGTVPPPLPARDQLPSCSHRKNPSRPCKSAETRRSAPGFPRPGPAIPQLRTPPYPDAALRSSLAEGTSPASAPAAGPPRPPPPSARFQIEIPWLGPSEDSRASPAPSRRKLLPHPRRTRPRCGNPRGPRHAPYAQATPPPRPGLCDRLFQRD